MKLYIYLDHRSCTIIQQTYMVAKLTGPSWFNLSSMPPCLSSTFSSRIISHQQRILKEKAGVQFQGDPEVSFLPGKLGMDTRR